MTWILTRTYQNILQWSSTRRQWWELIPWGTWKNWAAISWASASESPKSECRCFQSWTNQIACFAGLQACGEVPHCPLHSHWMSRPWDTGSHHSPRWLAWLTLLGTWWWGCALESISLWCYLSESSLNLHEVVCIETVAVHLLILVSITHYYYFVVMSSLLESSTRIPVNLLNLIH